MGERLGRYQLERKLGSGGMAEVWLARAEGPRGFSRQVVVKRIHSALLEEPRFVEMFLEEASLVARLSHPNVVQLFDFGEDAGTPFLAMEWMDGPSLRDLVRAARGDKRLLPPEICARLVSMACEGLAYAHEVVDLETGVPLRLVHRDVSPDNLLLSRTGVLKVADFGIARSAVQKHRTKTGTVKGKLAYMAPEQLRSEPLDGRADQYALGVVFYELLTGSRPHDVKGTEELMRAVLEGATVPLVERREDVPEALVGIIDRAMDPDPARRFPDCRALQRALDGWLTASGFTVSAWDVAQWLKAPTATLASPQPTLGSLPESTPPSEVATVTVPVPSPVPHEPAPAPGPAASSPSAPAGPAPSGPGPASRQRVAALLGGTVLLAAVGAWWLHHRRGTDAPVAPAPVAVEGGAPGAAASPLPSQPVPVRVASPPPSGDAGTPETAGALFDRAVDAVRSKRHAEARELAQACLDREATHAGCRLLRADASLWSADSASAEGAYVRALEDAKGGSTVPEERLAQVRWWLKRYDLARGFLWSGRYALESRTPAEALAAFQQCVELAPELPECHLGSAEASLKLKKTAGALRGYRRYLELAPLAGDARDVQRKLAALPGGGPLPGAR
ncbi:MAG: serine/threonine protein kinase [Pseudomonadota bacterium]|jgi:serine/threonine-protein kinase